VGNGGELDAEEFLRVVGKRIRILRLTRELTQDELAAAAGISRSFVSLVEHGAKGIDVVRLMRIAAALDVPLPELVQPP
jgi:transcriptional regulator with XRE-family HTH domain